MTLGISKSVVIDLPRDIKDVLVADPKIANAVVRTSRRAFIIGSAVGQTNMFFFDAEGKQIAGFDIAVTRDLNGIRPAIHQVLPDADITVEGIGDGVILSGIGVEPGRVAAGLRHRGAFARRRFRHGPHGSKIVNAIIVRGRDQVMLKVDRRRSRARRHQAARHQSVRHVRLWHRRGQLQQHQSVFRHRAVAQQFEHHRRLFKSVTATLQAMEQAGVMRTLAEPNLTAISGESATFVAGGEFPIPNGLSLRHHASRADLSAVDRIQEIRRQPQLHAGRAQRRPHQPQGDDRSVGPVDRKIR